uniref:MBL fold metallo-hydrolase n=1 Tax=candidate division WOR-3 bacterium TaxID=2052148 RepID=A0A7C3YSB7_UNCW3
MKLGRLEIYPILDGYFALDGGAMFGIIPKVLWDRTNPADERNRIQLALRALLVKTPNYLILIDTGIGDKFNDKFAEIYKIDKSPTIEKSLAEIGVSPDEIDLVINTHLHFDHAGGNTIFTEGKGLTLRFPRAKYLIQEKEWRVANNPDCRSTASYLRENFLPLRESNNLSLLSGNERITEGVEVILTGGHTEGHQIVLLTSEGKKAVYWGDLIPTTSHLKIPYIMGYDLFPLVTMEKKKELLSRAQAEGWLMVFEHDPKFAFAYFDEEGEIKFL